MIWKILVADSIADEGIDILRKAAEVDVRTGLKPEELAGIIGDYDALVVRSATKAPANIVEAGKRLQVIGRAGVGVDNIDLEAATKRGIVVVNAPAGNIRSAAEHTVALLLSLARHVPQACAKLKAGDWAKKAYTGTELQGKTLGILGLGRVGEQVTRMVKGLEMKLIACDPYVSAEKAKLLGVELVSLEDLLKRSDFITVHLPMTASTKGIIGKKELKLVKPTVRFINTARGGIIDEDALYEAIEAGRVAGAAIDVFAKEPAIDNVLLRSDKVIVTPHLGASTEEAQTSVAVDVAGQVLDVLNGRPALYAVNIPLMAADTAKALRPFIPVASAAGSLCAQLVDGHVGAITIKYEGEIAGHDTAVLMAAVLGGLLESATEERVNLVNANIIAQSRGLKVTEEKTARCENYTSLISVEVTTEAGKTTVAGTLLRSEPHIVRVDNYWIDIVPTGGYWLFSDHLDRPGLIGAVGMVTGNADVNISSMQVGRLEKRGRALMILSVDKEVTEDVRQQLLAVPGVYNVKVVKL
jgi:D-3-phosphoglycerate dehydrogenase